MAVGYIGLLVLWFRPERRIVVRHAPEGTTHPSPRPAPAPNVTFTEVTGAAGLHFIHRSGGSGKLFFPEVFGPGCGFFDYDNDGDQDLILVNSARWDTRGAVAEEPPATHSLYRNGGEGRFVDIGGELGLKSSRFAQGLCVGDIDNDGFTDLYVTGVGPDTLFWNDRGKRFVDITEEAGLGNAQWSVSAAFFDYDRDGLLDLFVGNFVKWSPSIQGKVRAAGSPIGAVGPRAGTAEVSPTGKPSGLPVSVVQDYGRYGSPSQFGPSLCRLYRNLGGRRFEDVSSAAGIERPERGSRPSAKALGVAVRDYNDDGWPDVAVANDAMADYLFRNSGKGTFRDVAPEVGLSTNNCGLARSGMGVSWADFRNDGSIALAIGNFSGETIGLYVTPRESREIFIDVAAPERMGHASWKGVMWGLFFFDYDLDGWLDFFVANGSTEPVEEEDQPCDPRQAAVLYRNRGRTPYFEPISPDQAGHDLFEPLVARGAAYGDIDGDGDLDILVTSNNGPAKLFRNEAPPGQHRLRVELTGVKSNRSAIGAKVKVRTGKLWQRREVTSGGSYASQSERALTFGLGGREQADELAVWWPSGAEQRFQNVSANVTVRLREGDSRLSLSPLRRPSTGRP